MALSEQDLNLILNGSTQELKDKLYEDQQFIEDIKEFLRNRETVNSDTISLSDLADDISLKDALKQFTDKVSSKTNEKNGAVYKLEQSINLLNQSYDLFTHLLRQPDLRTIDNIFQYIDAEAQKTPGSNYKTALDNFLKGNSQLREESHATFAFLDSAAELYRIGAMHPDVNFMITANLKRTKIYFLNRLQELVEETTKLEAQTSRIATAENTTLGANMDIVQYLAHNGEHGKLAALQKYGISMESLNKSITISSNIDDPDNADISATVPFKALCQKDTLEFCGGKALTSPPKKFDLKIGGPEAKKVDINNKIMQEIDEARNQKLSDLAHKITLDTDNSKNLQKKFAYCEEIRNSEAEKIEKDRNKNSESAYKVFKLLVAILATALMAYLLGGIGLEIFTEGKVNWGIDAENNLFKSTIGTGLTIAGGLAAGVASYAAITKGMDALVYGQRKMASGIGNSIGGEYKDKRFTQAVSELINQLNENDRNELGLEKKDQRQIEEDYNKACITQFGNVKPRFDMDKFINLITGNDTGTSIDARQKHNLTQLLTGKQGINELLNSSQTDLRKLQKHRQSPPTTFNSRQANQAGRAIGV